MRYTAISAAALIALANATPTPVRRQADLCGQWDTVETGGYTVYNNLWGQDAADSGSQCFGVDGLDGDSLSWHASWSWSGGQGSVKSYPNVVIDSSRDSSLQISGISSMQSTWSWSYSGEGIVTNVAYDVFTSSTAEGSEEFEIMVWLAALGGAGPISSTYGADGKPTPIGSATLAGQNWNLFKGPNGQMTVFSFVPADGSQVNDFSGDLKVFFDYLADEQGYDEGQYLISAGGGSETFEGSDAVFTTTGYSISIA